MPQVPEGYRPSTWIEDTERGYQDWISRGRPMPAAPRELDAQQWMYAGWAAGWFALWSLVRAELGYDNHPAGSDGASVGEGPKAAA